MILMATDTVKILLYIVFIPHIRIAKWVQIDKSTKNEHIRVCLNQTRVKRFNESHPAFPSPYTPSRFIADHTVLYKLL